MLVGTIAYSLRQYCISPAHKEASSRSGRRDFSPRHNYGFYVAERGRDACLQEEAVASKNSGEKKEERFTPGLGWGKGELGWGCGGICCREGRKSRGLSRGRHEKEKGEEGCVERRANGENKLYFRT